VTRTNVPAEGIAMTSGGEEKEGAAGVIAGIGMSGLLLRGVSKETDLNRIHVTSVIL